MISEDVYEPDNAVGTEFCAVANYTQADANLVWGWSDSDCQNEFPAICKVLREWRQRLGARARALCCRFCCLASRSSGPRCLHCPARAAAH